MPHLTIFTSKLKEDPNLYLFIGKIIMKYCQNCVTKGGGYSLLSNTYVCRIKGAVTGWNNPNIPIHYLYPSPDINKTINPRKGHVTRTGETKFRSKILSKNLKGIECFEDLSVGRRICY